MGWTFVHKRPGQSVKEFFQEEFDYNQDGRYDRVADCAVVNLNTAYIAYETGDATGAKEITAIVCLLKFAPNDYYNFGYKDMGEDMHPYYYDCPERILKLLTPTDNKLANEWREKCWKNLRARKSRPKLAKGMVIEFNEPIAFRNGLEEKIFRVIDPRRLIFADVGNIQKYKLLRSTLRDKEWKVFQA